MHCAIESQCLIIPSLSKLFSYHQDFDEWEFDKGQHRGDIPRYKDPWNTDQPDPKGRKPTPQILRC